MLLAEDGLEKPYNDIQNIDKLRYDANLLSFLEKQAANPTLQPVFCNSKHEEIPVDQLTLNIYERIRWVDLSKEDKIVVAYLDITESMENPILRIMFTTVIKASTAYIRVEGIKENLIDRCDNGARIYKILNP